MALGVSQKSFSRVARSAVCTVVCLIIQPWHLAVLADTVGGAATTSGALTADAARTAEILGIRREAEQIISLRNSRSLSNSERHQLNTYRALVVRKVFEADLQTQTAESRMEFEIAYAYDAITRQQRKENTVNQLLNAANFTQAGIFGILSASADLNNKFIIESTESLISGSVGTAIPIVSILYGKVAKASHLTPPPFMAPYVKGKPVDGSDLPPLVMRYLDSPAPGETRTRRELLNEEWKRRYNADMADKKTLNGIDDGKSRSQYYLNNRLLLLWSLYTTIEGFNYDLLALLNQVRASESADHQSQETGSAISTGAPSTSTATSSGAADAARLLNLEPVVAELKSLNATGQDSERKRELQITLLETLVSGGLDMAVAGDRCQKELNYQYDVALAQLTDKQSSIMQKIYEANFIQYGVFGATASTLYLKKYQNTAGEVLLVSGGIGLTLTGVSFLAMRGGSRKTDTGPNSLADFFNLRPPNDKGFSPLVMAYLNSAEPDRKDGKSRRQCLMESWTNRSVATVNLKNRRTLEQLGSMPSCKRDTIKLVLNRIALLTSLRQQLNEFDVEILQLLREAWPVNTASTAPEADPELSPYASAAANLLGVQGVVSAKGQEDEDAKLLITRQVLEGFLSLISDADIVGHEIDEELKAMNRMERMRDRAVQITDSVNFLQGGVLGQIATALGLTNRPENAVAGNYIVIASSAIGTGLAALSMLEQHGGWRGGKVKPNALVAAFGKNSPKVNLSPITVRYLDSVAPDSKQNLSRREMLVKYWKESKVLSVNVKRDSEIQKLSAEGKSHHWWSETIKLINNRITMLYDLRAVMRSSNVGFYELLKSVD